MQQQQSVQYLLSGIPRKKYKRELNSLKSFVRYFWHFHQLEKDMCGAPNDDACYPMPDEQAKQVYDKACEKIKQMEHQLTLTVIKY